MSAEEGWGGYSYEFVNTPPDRLVCKICYLPSRIPHLTECCGSIVCKSCLGRTTVKSVICTSCGREKFGATYNKNLEGEIKRLYIYCIDKKKGCQWRGELDDIESRRHFEKGCPIQQQQHVDKHLESEGCRRQSVNCHDIEEHQIIKDQHNEEHSRLIPCPNKCRKGRTVHHDDIEAHRMVCPLEIIQCNHHSVGCKAKMARKDLDKHRKEKMEDHHLMTIQAKICELESKLSATKTEAENKVAEVSERARNLNEKIVAIEQTVDTLQGKFHAEFKKIQEAQNNTFASLLKDFTRQSQLDQWISLLHLSVSGNKICPVILKIHQVEDKKIHSKEWRSDPFYTHDKGYRMCLLVIFNGTNHVNATYVSVFLYLMKGPYDDDLKWPLIRNFEITLLNQKKDEEHYIDEISFMNDTPKTVSDKIKARQFNEIAHGGLGCERYIAYNDLKKITYSCQYLKDDCMYIKIC